MKPYRLLLGLLMAVQFSHALDFMILMPLGPKMMVVMAISPQQYALLLSAYTFAAGVAGFTAAFLLDRFDRKAALVLLFTGFTAGTIWCGFAHTYWSLLAARIVAGAFGGITGSLCMAIVADVVPREHRATAIGVVTSAFSVASVLGIPFAVYLANAFGWNIPFLVLGGVAVLVLGGIAIWVPTLRGHIRPGGGGDSPATLVRHLAGNRGQLQGLAIVSLSVLGHFTMIPMLATYLVRNVGLAEAALPMMYLVGGLVNFGANPAIGYMADKVGKRRVFIIMSLAALVPLLLISNLPAVPVYVALCATALLFCLSGTRFTPAMAVVSEQVEPAHRGSYMGFVSCIQQVSSGCAALLAGYMVAEGAGPGHPLIGYWQTGVFCVVCTLGAIWVAMQVRPTVVAATAPVVLPEAEVV